MARPLRRAIADGWYHVFGRGNERRALFGGQRDRERFLELLAVLPGGFARGRVLEAKGWRVPTAEQVSERLGRLRAYGWSS